MVKLLLYVISLPFQFLKSEMAIEIGRFKRPRTFYDLRRKIAIRFVGIIYLTVFLILMFANVAMKFEYRYIMIYYSIIPMPIYSYFNRHFILFYLATIYLIITNIYGFIL